MRTSARPCSEERAAAPVAHALTASPPLPALSVVVPTLDEAASGLGVLEALHAQLGPADELLLVDGGSRDGTLALARGLGLARLRAVVAERGRAAQMNRGASLARGDWILFLHADSIVPPNLLDGLRAATRRPTAGWGHFRARVHAPGRRFRWIELGMDLRSRAFHTPSGDQGVFVRRDVFAALGGYPQVPLGEDLLLVDLLRRRGPPAVARPWLGTSARRWRRGGVTRTVLLMWALRLGLRLGVPPRCLAAGYPAVR